MVQQTASQNGKISFYIMITAQIRKNSKMALFILFDVSAFFVFPGPDATVSTPRIQDLPPEILQNNVFKHLDGLDIYNLGNAGSTKLKDISEDYVQLGKT